jgi:hypothetical protein
MAKEKKTRKEIATLILGRCIERNLRVRRVTVLPSDLHGWVASFAADPNLVMIYTSRFENIVEALRETFELAED